MGDPFRLRYEPSFDGLRAVAVLLVFAHHTAFPGVHGGSQGVTVFFVLSGFLITTLLLTELEDFGSISLAKFYARRALRLLPALFALLAFTAVWALLAEHGGGRTSLLRDIALTAAYVQNIGLGVRHLDTTWGLVGHCWSLAVEEQFYVLWPLALLLLVRRRLSPRATVVLVLVGALAIAAWRAALASSHPDLLWPHVTLDTRGDALLIGCAAAMACSWGLVRTDGQARPAVRSALGVAGVAGIFLFSIRGDMGALTAARVGYLGVAIGTVVLLLDLVRPVRSPMSLVLTLRPLVLLGRISYAFYLWHFFIVVWLRGHWGWSEAELTPRYAGFLAVGFAASTGMAALSMVVVERPFLRRKVRFQREPMRPAPLPVRATLAPGEPPSAP